MIEWIVIEFLKFVCKLREYLRMPYTSLILFVEDDSNMHEDTSSILCITLCVLSKVVWISIRIPEDVIRILVSLCRRWFEYRFQYLRMWYTSLLLFVDGDSIIDGNTWWCHTHTCFSSSKVIWIFNDHTWRCYTHPCVALPKVIRIFEGTYKPFYHDQQVDP